MQTTPIFILDAFRTAKNPKFLDTGYYNEASKAHFSHNNTYRQNHPEYIPFDNQGPFNYDEAFNTFRLMPDKSNITKLPYIKQEFLNKQFKIGDYTVYVQYDKKAELREPQWEFSKSGYRSRYFDEYQTWIIVIEFKGAYRQFGKYRVLTQIQADECLPTQTNWFNMKPTEEKPWIMREMHFSYEHNIYEDWELFFLNLDASRLELTDIKLPKQHWYEFDGKKETQLPWLSLSRDFVWFIQSESKNGIWRPEPATLNFWLFTEDREKYPYKILIANRHNFDKKILQKIGIHTIQLRADAHFDVPSLFDLGTDVKIKAPAKVIEKYDLEKYCKDNDVVEKVSAKKKKEKEQAMLEEHNNKFTLMHHGKVIFDNIHRDKIIAYLESYNPKGGSFDSSLIQRFQPIFDAYPTVTKIFIAYWGRYFKSELAGETCDDLNATTNGAEVWKEIVNLYNDVLDVELDDRFVESVYGWPERGGLILFIKKLENGKFEVATEDYDFE
jgi:hypothetical protein